MDNTKIMDNINEQNNNEQLNADLYKQIFTNEQFFNIKNNDESKHISEVEQSIPQLMNPLIFLGVINKPFGRYVPIFAYNVLLQIISDFLKSL